MAESVDALVSNTSGATRAGSTPALGTRSEEQKKCCRHRVWQHFFLYHFLLLLLLALRSLLSIFQLLVDFKEFFIGFCHPVVRPLQLMIGLREFLIHFGEIAFGLSQFLLLLGNIVEDGYQQQ